MKKLLALVLVMVLMCSFAISKAEEEQEAASGDIFDSVSFFYEEDRDICRKVVEYISLHAGTDVYWKYSFLGTVHLSIDGGKVYLLSIKEGMPDDETMDALIEKNLEDIKSMAKVPLGYFTIAEAEEKFNSFFKGTDLSIRRDGVALVIYKRNVEWAAISFMYGPDGSLYCRKRDVIDYIQMAGW